jgi:hypothetical protein
MEAKVSCQVVVVVVELALGRYCQSCVKNAFWT